MSKAAKTAKQPKVRNIFITFEGGEGAGKSTQIKLLEKKLNSVGYNVVVTREPGGTTGAEILRHVILSGAAEKLGAETEAMLFAAARSDHIENVIKPALEAGKTVLCDRFIDSTRVYQGASGKVDIDYLKELENVVCEDIWPNLTLILDLDVEIGMKRANSRRGAKNAPDRFEKEDISAQKQRRDAFLKISEEDPERCVIINAKGSENQVFNRVWKAVEKRLKHLESASDG